MCPASLLHIRHCALLTFMPKGTEVRDMTSWPKFSQTNMRGDLEQSLIAVGGYVQCQYERNGKNSPHVTSKTQHWCIHKHDSFDDLLCALQVQLSFSKGSSVQEEMLFVCLSVCPSSLFPSPNIVLFVPLRPRGDLLRSVLRIKMKSNSSSRKMVTVSANNNRFRVTFHHTCKKRGIAGIYPRNFFWIFRKILG